MKKDMKDNTMIIAALTTLASGIVLCFLSCAVVFWADAAVCCKFIRAGNVC